MYNIDIIFVILHYNVTNETFNCVNSIKENIDTKNYYIIIVDNNSPNKSGPIINEKYNNDDKVHVILNKENLGFAKGNNIGIDYARTLNPKYICCVNNDTLLEQTNFYQILDNEFMKSQAAIIGPRVILKDNSTQDFNMFFYNINEYKRRLHDYEGKKYNHFKRFIIKLFSKTMIVNKLKLLYTRHIEHFNKNKKNVVIHGCCIIFTPIFFTKLSGFNPKTFLYVEEELLYFDLKNNGLLSLYCPKLSIRHLEDASTDSVHNSNDEKMKFINKYEIESLKILIEEMEHKR